MDVLKRFLVGLFLMIIGVYMFPTLKILITTLHGIVYNASSGTPLYNQSFVWVLFSFLPIAIAIGWIVLPLVNAFRERKRKAVLPPPGYGRYE
jgi:hypothetical protein